MIWCDPTDSDAMERLAVEVKESDALTTSVPTPSDKAPSKNSTGPELPATAEVTVAVSTTA